MQILKKDLKIYQNDDFLELKNFLSKHTKRAYFVGGFVRDFFMQKSSLDIDIEVFDISPDKFDELMNEFGAKGLGKSFYVYKYKNFDISLPRTEKKVGIGHKAFDVKLCNDEKTASKRRDFTINSIMIDIFNLNVLDFYGGISDIKNKILKVVDEKTFIEDSLRVLRAVQFVARFGLKVDKNSLNLMKSMNLNDLSSNRVQVELKKLFNSNFQALGLDLIKELNLFNYLFLCDIFDDEYLNLRNLIDNGTKFVKNEMYFLYITLNFLNLDKEKVLKRLNLNSEYKKILTEPYFKEITPENLLEISLKMPLCEWLGLDNEDKISLAKKLKIYDSKFDSGVKSKDVIKDGFMGKEIGLEISKRENLAIKRYLKAYNSNFKA